jgi:hypothetical protein
MRKKEKRYNQLIAVNLIPKMKEFEQNPPPIIGFTISRVQYLISLILSHKQDNHPGAWSVLKMEYMEPVVPGSGKYMIFLRDQKIIEWKNHFAGRNSRLYRLKDEGKTEYREITDKKLIFRIEKNRRKISLRNSKKYPALNEYIHRVGIDYQSALKTIDKTYRNNIIEGNKNAESRRTFSLSEIDKIQTGEIYIKVNPTNKRLDSNYTRLPGELVQHLTIDGKPLTEIDIKNSQPFFAACLFNPTPEILNIMNMVLGHRLTILAISLQISEQKDVKLYRSLVTSGEFYEYMMNKFKENGIFFKDREDFKEQLFTIYFGEVSAKRFSKAVRLFAKEFPNVQILFETIKKDEYNLLSILLQNIESFVILDNVAQKILKELSGLPFITKHDSLLPAGILTSDQPDKVKDIMLSSIKEITGLMPQVRIKNCLQTAKKRLDNNLFIINNSLSIYNH